MLLSNFHSSKVFLFQIPFANTAAIAAITAPSTTYTYIHRFCGRFIALATSATATVTICSKFAFKFPMHVDVKQVSYANNNMNFLKSCLKIHKNKIIWKTRVPADNKCFIFILWTLYLHKLADFYIDLESYLNVKHRWNLFRNNGTGSYSIGK